MEKIMDGVLYWSVGEKHTEHFIVSVISLREHWKGPIAVVVGDIPSKEIAQQLKLDHIVDISKEWQSLRRRNAHYLVKTMLNQYTPFDRTIFMDLDTLILGDITNIFPQDDEIVLTLFSNWLTTGPAISKRIHKFDSKVPIIPGPAINTGVFGWKSPAIEIFNKWFLTTQNRLIFMADELAMQVLYTEFVHRILDDRWNWSPKCSIPNDDVRIAHGHGFKFHKTVIGRKLWLPYYEKAKEAGYITKPFGKKLKKIYEQVTKSS